MRPPEKRYSLQIEPRGGGSWTSGEVVILIQLKLAGKTYEEISDRLPGRTLSACQQRYFIYLEGLRDESRMDHLARLYESHKAEMWAKVAEEMSVPWTEAEANHWRLGKAEIARRGRDESFSTACVDLSQLRVDDAEVQSQRQQQDQQQLQRIEWSGKEETLLFACKRAGKSWEEIAEYLPERTITSCKGYYYRLLRRCDGWSPELQNKLCRIYERSKPEMWAKIGHELLIVWGSAEEMHWRLRAGVTAERAGISTISQPAANLAQEHDRIQQLQRHTTHSLFQAGTSLPASEQRPRSSVTLPSFAVFTAGVELSFRPPPRET